MVDMPLTAGALTGVIFPRQQPVRSSRFQDKTEAYLFNICNLWELGHSVYNERNPWEDEERMQQSIDSLKSLSK